MASLGEIPTKEEEEFTTFEDVFALALANTDSNYFIADSKSWKLRRLWLRSLVPKHK